MITLSLIFVRTRNDSDRNCRCTKNAFYFQYILFHKILHLMYQFGEIWCTSNSITRHMHSACRINKARIRTLRRGNICSFFSSTIFRRTHSNERLHVRCLSCHTLTTHDTTPFAFYDLLEMQYSLRLLPTWLHISLVSKIKYTPYLWRYNNWVIQIFL